MTIAILIASVIAAAAALVSFVLVELRRRPRLKLEFTGSWSAREQDITFLARLSNDGETRISQIDVFLLAPGELLNDDRRLARLALEPGQWTDVAVPIARPARIDVRPNTTNPELAVPIAVLAWYGRHRAIVRHPNNPPGNENAYRDVLKRRWRNARPSTTLPIDET